MKCNLLNWAKGCPDEEVKCRRFAGFKLYGLVCLGWGLVGILLWGFSFHFLMPPPSTLQTPQKSLPRPAPLPLLNQPLPNFKVEALENDPPMTLSNQDFLGHVTVLNVWQSNCHNCRLEDVELKKITPKIYVYGLDYQDQRSSALRWLKQVKYPYMLNFYDPDGKLGKQLGGTVPSDTFLIDQNGIIRYKYQGELTRRIWQNQFLPRIHQLQAGSD